MAHVAKTGSNNPFLRLDRFSVTFQTNGKVFLEVELQSESYLEKLLAGKVSERVAWFAKPSVASPQ